MQGLFRLLGVDDATADERRATLWSAAMFFCTLAAPFVLRPLRDQLAVASGVRGMPYLYGLTLLVTAAVTPLFWWIATRLPSRRFVPIALQVLAGCMLLLFFGLQAIGDFDWARVPWFGDVFWGFYNTFNFAAPALFWIHAVEHFRRQQGLRLFGLIGVGGTLGAVAGPGLAWVLCTRLRLPPSSAAIAAFVLLVAAWLAYRRSLPACERLRAVAGVMPPPAPRGGVWSGLRLLLRSRRLCTLAGYFLLMGMVATAFAAAQVHLVGSEVHGGRRQFGFLSELDIYTQSLVLALQLFATGRLLRRLPQALFLGLLAVMALLGLGVLSLWPTAVAIGAVMVVRRGAQFALEKPAREVLYTPFDLETKHKVKFLLDVFMLRLGDWLGACCQVYVFGGSLGASIGATAGLAVLWGGLGIWLGRSSERSARGAAAGAGGRGAGVPTAGSSAQ